MDDNRQFHPAAELFPLLRGPAFQELVADIRKNGLIKPILVDREGRILDGRNRYRACLEAGVEPRFIEWQGDGDLAELVLSLNLHRRHLDESQRALVAARLASLLEAEALKRRGRRKELVANLQLIPRRRSSCQAAARVNVSPRLVSYAVKILKDGCDELVAAVESGGVAVSAASALVGLPPEEQAKVVAEGARAAARKARELRSRRSNGGPARTSPGCFGVVRSKAPTRTGYAGADGVVLLWVAAEVLDRAIRALRAAGLEYAASEN
jgi:ParB-like chromosome segregation protein Spo0J